MTQNLHIKQRNRKLGQKVVASLQKRHFDAYFCENKEQVLNKISELVSIEDTISAGGSTTLNELGIIEFLQNNSYQITARDRANTPQEKEEISKKAMLCDVFLMSTNALSEDGELVNIDGLGNRVAALCFGPKNIIVVAGINKVAKNLQAAYERARNLSAPINLQRIASKNPETETPCLYSGSCADCLSPQSICSQIVTTRLCRPKGRIKVIMVNEELGF